MGNTHPVVVGENIEKEDNHGLENWTFSRIELNWTSVGTGFALILGLILMYNVIRMSSLETWARLLHCNIPCCNFTTMWRNTKPERDSPNKTINHDHFNVNVSRSSRRSRWGGQNNKSYSMSSGCRDMYQDQSTQQP